MASKMFRIVIALIFAISAWRWGDWRNWKQYYPTMLFFALGDFIYLFLTFRKPLWTLDSPLIGCTAATLICAFIIYPSIDLIYLPYFPEKGLIRKALYIIASALLLTSVEFISYGLGNISYHNGWNIWWSFLFSLVMFTLLRIHYKKPLLGLLVAGTLGTCIMLFFKIPLPR